MFLPIVLVSYLIFFKMNKDVSLAWLIASSLFFYMYWDVAAGPVLITSIIANFLISKQMESSTGIIKSILLIFGVVGNLLALCFYKYAGFLLHSMELLCGFQSVAGSEYWSKIVLPIGISFYTFQQIAFLVDSSRQQVQSPRFLNYAALVTFFPHLIAGPIVNAKEALPEFSNRKFPTLPDIAVGLTLLIVGLFKKTIVADTLALPSDALFASVTHGNQPSMTQGWFGVFCYTFQIYYDFSGYSDMAVGLAKLFGINFPINFASPYKSRSIVEFWKRWHISLSRFLRDYLYIPLGGNRTSNFRVTVNLAITMIIGGFWHGAAWTFIMWGVLHGAFIIIHRWWEKSLLALVFNKFLWWQTFAWSLTLLCVTIAWVPFRADSAVSTWQIWRAMAGFNGIDSLVFSHNVFEVTTLVLAGVGTVILPNAYEFFRAYNVGIPSKGYAGTFVKNVSFKWRPSPFSAVIFGIMFVWVVCKLNDISTFLYFQF